MESDTAPGTTEQAVPESLKHFFLSLCRLSQQNGFGMPAKTDQKNQSYALPAAKQTPKRKGLAAGYGHIVEQMQERLDDVTVTNNRLTDQLNKILSHNKELEEKVEKLEQVPVVKLIPKDKTRKPLIISKKEFEYLQDLKSRIKTLQERYEALLHEEDYDSRLLENYRERIDLLKQKLIERSHAPSGIGAQQQE